ncbi:MAG TPA: nuclear transport factor 2 family protein [Gammaproteobacteria bacterium]|nr:nuclear transport factor 2 family protein [Gammaproteobacteria bacterium]
MKNKLKLLPIVFSMVAIPLSVIAQEQSAKPVQGKVVAVSGSNVVVDLGTKAGLQGGEKMLVSAPWEIIHSNGQKTWKGEREVGFVRVVAVGEEQALADIISGSANKGDHVQVLAGLTEQAAPDDETSQRLNEWISAFNSGAVDRWMDLLADDAEWINPDTVLRGKAAIWSNAERKDWDRQKYVEDRRIVYGNTIAWEGTFEATDEDSGKQVRRPLIMMIDFNQQGKIKRLSSYYDLNTGVEKRE